MKKICTIIIVSFALAFFFSSCTKSPVKLEFSVIDSVYNVAGINYPADFCKMQILENPTDRDSKVIDIPVIRIRTNSNSPGAPVFILNDGPGISNFSQMMPTWLAENHDLIIMGYRGVDGSVNLQIPELTAIIQNSNFLSENNLQLAGNSFSKGFKKLEDSLGIDLKQYNLYNMAFDLESARKAFQYEKINIYAVGFGSRIAQIYSKVSPNSVFRLFLERPKGFGSLILQPKDIDRVLENYDIESINLNNGLTFKQHIIKAISALPNEYKGHIFDKDRILFQILNVLNTVQGAALVNEACSTALVGDFESMKFLDESFKNSIPKLNYGDYAIKSLTSEFNPNINYSADLAYNPSRNSLGSPISQFIFGSIQKSGFKVDILEKSKINPDSLKGESLSVIVNLDIFAPSYLGEFALSTKYENPHIILLTDYTPQDLYTKRVAEYSQLIANFLYSGNYLSYMPEAININLVPDKSLKQISLERIQ